MNKKVVSYHRVSPTKHDKIAIEGDNRPLNEIVRDNMHKSLMSSIEKCRKQAEVDGLKIEHEYIDQYKSGKSQEHMQDFQKMMNAAENGEIARIYVRRVNRFGRNMNQSIKALVRLLELDISVYFVENGLDTNKPFMKSVIIMLTELAEMERETIEENTRLGREKAIANGVKFGQPKKEINVEALRRDRMLPIAHRPTWKECEQRYAVKDGKGKLIPVSTATLIKRLKEAGYWDEANRTVI